MPEELIIRPWMETDAVAQITHLLHDAYAALLAAGFRYSASVQDEIRTLQRLRSGLAYVAVRDGALIGTVTLYRPSTTSICEYYQRPNVFHFGQFGVRSDLQRGGVGFRLYQHIERVAVQSGASEMALDTAEGATHLHRGYERLGFRFVQYLQWQVTNYRSVVMAKPLGSRAE